MRGATNKAVAKVVMSAIGADKEIVMPPKVRNLSWSERHMSRVKMSVHCHFRVQRLNSVDVKPCKSRVNEIGGWSRARPICLFLVRTISRVGGGVSVNRGGWISAGAKVTIPDHWKSME